MYMCSYFINQASNAGGGRKLIQIFKTKMHLHCTTSISKIDSLLNFFMIQETHFMFLKTSAKKASNRLGRISQCCEDCLIRAHMTRISTILSIPHKASTYNLQYMDINSEIKDWNGYAFPNYNHYYSR